MLRTFANFVARRKSLENLLAKAASCYINDRTMHVVIAVTLTEEANGPFVPFDRASLSLNATHTTIGLHTACCGLCFCGENGNYDTQRLTLPA